MSPWFTVEEIDKATFAISEYKHWEETHCYLVCGNKRALLIDTGLGVSNIKRVVDELTSLPVSTVLTHAHWDHIGGLKWFQSIAVHEFEQEWLSVQFPISLQLIKENLTKYPCSFPSEFHLDDYRLFHGAPQQILHDGDCLDLGGRELTVFHTPGHSPGHCCFYDSIRQYLFTGDLIYKGCLDAFYPSTDPLLFYQSVVRVRKCKVSRLLPGHHELNVPVSLMADIESGFAELHRLGKLQQGEGIIDFGGFQIHI